MHALDRDLRYALRLVLRTALRLVGSGVLVGVLVDPTLALRYE